MLLYVIIDYSYNNSLHHYLRFYNATHGELSEGRNMKEAQREMCLRQLCWCRGWREFSFIVFSFSHFQ